MDIGLEARLGVPVGVANVVAAHARLQAKFASHNSESFPTDLCAPFSLVTGRQIPLVSCL